MESVPSTPTATDKLEEVRKLNIEIAAFKSAKETAKRVADEAIKAAADATKRVATAKEHLATLESTMAGSAAEIREFVATCRNILQVVQLGMDEVAESAKAMEKHVSDLDTQIAASQAALDALRVATAKENETISTKRDDLDVYHKRIIAAAEVHLPGQPVVI